MATFKNIYTIRLLRMALGLFFIVLGIFGVLPNIEESMFNLNNNNITLEIIFGVMEIICGLLLLFGYIAFSTSKSIYLGGLVIFIFWLARIVLTKVIWCLKFTDNSISFIFRPNLYDWILSLSCELIIAAALMVVIKRYD